MTDKSIRNKKAIVVDDLYDARTIITNFLRSNGYEVSVFKLPEEIDVPIEDYGTIFMDVRFSKPHPELGKISMPYGGLDYILNQINNNKLDPNKTKIIIFSRWDQNRPEIKERLSKIGKFNYMNIQDGLEIIKIKKLLDE